MVLDTCRDAFRVLRGSPGLSAAAILTLALGIAASTAVLSVADAVLVAALPYHAEHELIAVWEAEPSDPDESAIVPAHLERYRAASSLAVVAGRTRRSFTLTGGEPRQLRAEIVTWNFFDTVGVSPAPGRTFRSDEAGGRVAILSHALWRSRFAADPSVLGRTIPLNDEPYEVAGVTPPSFQPLSQLKSGFTIDIFVPMGAALLAQPEGRSIDMIARLAPHATFERARAELASISEQLAREAAPGPDFVAYVAPLRDTIVGKFRLPLLILLASAALVLLVACVNVANLVLVRAIVLQRDTAIRLALGATSSRVALDLATRGVLLGIAGGAVGLVAGVWARDALMSMVPATFPVVGNVGLNWRVLTAAGLLSIAAGAVAGVVPALSAGHDPAQALQTDGRTFTGTKHAARWRGTLMAVQIAVAIVLAVGGGLLARSFAALTSIELGWDPDVLLMTLRPPESRYPSDESRAALFERVEGVIAGVPGVESVAVASEFPLRGGSYASYMVRGEKMRAGFQSVSPGYFATLRIPMRRGRGFNATDRAGAPLVAIVSESFARRYASDAIGAAFTRVADRTPITIVGIVPDMRRDGRESPVRPQVYFPAAQSPAHDLRVEEIAVRSSGDVSGLLPAIQHAIWSIDRDQPVTNVQTLSGAIAETAKARRFNLTLLGVLAGIALLLALVGVYGVVAHAAAQRTREIGIRVALGADRRGVIRLVVRGGLVWVLPGVALGLAGALAAARLLRSLLFGVEPYDSATFIATGLVTVIVATLACYVPARRAASVDPLVALRAD